MVSSILLVVGGCLVGCWRHVQCVCNIIFSMYNVYDDYDYSDLCASVSGCCAFIAVYDDNGDDNCFDSMIDGDFDSVLID